MKEVVLRVVLEVLIQLMLPNNASRALQVDQLEAMCGLVKSEDKSSLKSSITPFIWLWVRIVDSNQSASQDLGWNDTFDFGLVVFRDSGL